MRRLLVLIGLIAGLWAGPQLRAQTTPLPVSERLLPVSERPLPVPERWVTDRAHFLSPTTREDLNQHLRAYQESTGHQVLVWIGNTTGGQPLEDVTVRTFAAWKVGRKGMDDGLVLFIFAKDRKVRMEVGYGLEGQVPDALASRILRETILPRLKAGDPDGAVREGVDRILKAIGGDPSAQATQSLKGQKSTSTSLGGWILLALLGLGFLVLAISHPNIAIGLLFSLLSGGRGGGGWSIGGGGGGGGWSGGGGSSGGGGASGSW